MGLIQISSAEVFERFLMIEHKIKGNQNPIPVSARIISVARCVMPGIVSTSGTAFCQVSGSVDDTAGEWVEG